MCTFREEPDNLPEEVKPSSNRLTACRMAMAVTSRGLSCRKRCRFIALMTMAVATLGLSKYAGQMSGAVTVPLNSNHRFTQDATMLMLNQERSAAQSRSIT